VEGISRFARQEDGASPSRAGGQASIANAPKGGGHYIRPTLCRAGATRRGQSAWHRRRSSVPCKGGHPLRRDEAERIRIAKFDNGPYGLVGRSLEAGDRRPTIPLGARPSARPGLLNNFTVAGAAAWSCVVGLESSAPGHGRGKRDFRGRYTASDPEDRCDPSTVTRGERPVRLGKEIGNANRKGRRIGFGPRGISTKIRGRGRLGP